MIELKFAPPTKPWSVNELTATRQGHAIRTKQKNKWRDSAWGSALEAKVKGLGPSNVHVTIPFERAMSRRDPHNYVGTVVKVIIDGLVYAGVWPDDNPQYVTVLEPSCVKGDTVIVTITPREETT